MRLLSFLETLNETTPFDQYIKLGIAPEHAVIYAKARLPVKFAKQGDEQVIKYNLRPDSVVFEYKRLLAQKSEDRWVAQIDQLASGTGPLSMEQACACIANDDELFDLIGTFTHSPDHLENNIETTHKLMALIQRVKPFKHNPFYRGQCSYSERDAHKRALHSWTRSRKTAEYFTDCMRGCSELHVLTQPCKGVSFETIGIWRMRFRQGESHYIGSQDEWLIPDGYPSRIITETEV